MLCCSALYGGQSSFCPLLQPRMTIRSSRANINKSSTSWRWSWSMINICGRSSPRHFRKISRNHFTARTFSIQALAWYVQMELEGPSSWLKAKRDFGVLPFTMNIGGIDTPAAFMQATTVMFSLLGDTCPGTLEVPFHATMLEGVRSIYIARAIYSTSWDFADRDGPW